MHSFKKRRALYLLTPTFLIAIFFLSSAIAEDINDIFSMSLQELTQVKVTIANRTEENFIDASSSVTVYTRKEIEELGVRTLTELFNYVPGFQSYMSPQESNRSMILSRGLPDIYGRNLLLMIDGHRINDEYTGGFTYTDHLLSLYNVKQIEFIRGPGSALYGSNAFSGVINIITDKRKDIVIAVGSNNAQEISASTFGSIGELESKVSFNYYRDNGQRYSNLTDKKGFGKSTQDPVEVFEGRFDLTYQRNRLIMEYMNTKLKDYYVFRRINNNINQNNSSRVGIYFEHDFKLTQGWQGSGRIGLISHKRQQQTLLNPTDTSFFRTFMQQDSREAQLDFTYLTLSNHQISLGTSLAFMNMPSSYNTFDARDVINKPRRTLGVYIQDQFNVLNNLRLTAGIRFDDYSDFGNSINPRLALLYRLKKNNSLKFMYGRAYRAPSLGDLYDKEGAISGGNLSLKPVVVNTYEMAYLHSKGNNNAILTWFYNDYHDFIGPRSDNIFDNVYDNHTQGLEIEMKWKLSNHWKSKFSLTHIISTNTQVKTGTNVSTPETLTPKNYGNLQLHYNKNNWSWNVSAVMHDGISVLQDKNMTALINSKYIYRIDKQWNLSINARNIFNKSYSTPQNQAVGQDQFGRNIQQLPSRGREIFLSLRYSGNI